MSRHLPLVNPGKGILKQDLVYIEIAYLKVYHNFRAALLQEEIASSSEVSPASCGGRYVPTVLIREDSTGLLE